MKTARFTVWFWVLGATAALAAPPPNDQFASATVMKGSYWLTNGSLFGATSEANEPVLTGYPNGPTAWWRWQATASGTVRVRTWGSEQDNLLAIYRGATLDTTRLVAYGTSHADRARSAEAVFAATAGETYSIQVLGADYATPVFIAEPFLPSRLQLSLTYSFGLSTPPNDKFANALIITGPAADLIVNNSGADAEPGEPLDQPGAQGDSVWLDWTAPSSGVWELDAQQGDFDNLVSVYTGTSVNNLTRLDFADQDYAATGNPYVGGGRVTFAATVGQKYHFQVTGAALAGAGLEYGNVRLTLQPVQPPANDDFAAATLLTGPSPSADGWTTFAHREIGEGPARVDESRSIWWRWIVPSTGLLAVIQYDGTVDVYTGSALANLVRPPFAPHAGTRGSLGAVTDWYAVTTGTTLWLRGSGFGDRANFSLRVVQPPANDDFASRKTLTGPVAADSVDLEYTSWENDDPQTSGFGPQTAWYRWVAPATRRFIISTEGSPLFTRVMVFTGTALNALTPAGEEALLGYSPYAFGRVILEAVAGTEYAIQLRRESIVTGLDQLGIRPASPPANDAFASAPLMAGSAWAATGSNVDGTTEPDEPFATFNDGPTGATTWWRWVAPASGLFRVTTAGSEINTVLAVYTGASLASLTQVALNQDSGWGSTGALALLANSGTTYYFQVDGQSRQVGALKLALSPISPPPNDRFVNRLPLTGATAVAAGTVLGATLEAGEPVIPGAQGGHSVWYEWTAPASGTALFRVTAPRFNPVFGLFTGDTLAALQPGITGGSGAATFNEQTFLASYPVSNGSRYKLRVDGAPETQGDFRLSVTMPLPPINDAFAARTILSGTVVHSSANNEGASSQAGEPVHAGGNARFSVWWEWIAPVSGTVSLDTVGSPAQARLAVYTGAAINALTPVASSPVLFPQGFSSLSFVATAGTRYVIAADSGDRSRGDIALNIVASPAIPPNDAFAAATVWQTDQAEVLVRPHGASAEPGEPAHGGRPAAKSVWWAWTPKSTRRAMIWFETQSEGLLARMVVYKGTALNNLTALVALPSDVHWSRLNFDALAGETYYLVLDTSSLAVDPGWIKVGIVPVNGNQRNALPLSPADGDRLASTEGASNEDLLRSPTSVRELWWYWVAEVNARMEWRALAAPGSELDLSVSSPDGFFAATANATTGRTVPGSGEISGTFDAVAGNLYFLKVLAHSPQSLSVRLRESPQQVPPSNDQRYRAQAMSGNSWSVPLTLGAESGSQLWWTWTAPSAGVAQLKLTGSLAEDDALIAYAEGELGMTTGTSHTDGGPPVLRIRSVAGQQWVFTTRSDLRRLRPATLSLVAPAPGTPPANDSWTTAQVLAQSWTRVNGDVTFASCEPGEPDHSASGGTQVATKLPPGRSVWYQWTPIEDGPVTLRLESTAPLAMQIYRGRSPAQWQVETFLKPGASLLPFHLLAGQTYHIAIATRPYDEQTGSFTLHRSAAAPNDMLAAAALLSGPSARGSAESAGATIERGEPGHGFNFEAPRASLWWKWTAPATGLVWIDTRGSEYANILAVFASDPPDTTARVAENQGASGGSGLNASAVVFAAVSGQSYFIRVCRSDTAEPSGLARVNVSMTSQLEPYSRWLADWPALTGAAAAETADPDGDGRPNLAELAFGGNPLQADASLGALRIFPVEGGFAVEATLDRDALEALYGGTAIEIEWQVSRDLKLWQPGPPSLFVRHEGRFSVERILLTPDDPPFARLAIRRLK